MLLLLKYKYPQRYLSECFQFLRIETSSCKKTKETLTEGQRQKQKSLNELINLSKSKVDKSVLV